MLISREISAGRTVHNRGNLGTVQGTSRLYEVVPGKQKNDVHSVCMVRQLAKEKKMTISITLKKYRIKPV